MCRFQRENPEDGAHVQYVGPSKVLPTGILVQPTVGAELKTDGGYVSAKNNVGLLAFREWAAQTRCKHLAWSVLDDDDVTTAAYHSSSCALWPRGSCSTGPSSPSCAPRT